MVGRVRVEILSEKQPHKKQRFLNVGYADGPVGVNNQASLDCESFLLRQQRLQSLFKRKNFNPNFNRRGQALCLSYSYHQIVGQT